MFVVGPATILLIGLPVSIWLGVGTFRAARRLTRNSTIAVQSLILSSVLWVPVAATYSFIVVFDGFQR